MKLHALACTALIAGTACAQGQYKVHDMSRPRPRVVTPPAQNLPAPVPPDATVLFDGKSAAEWAGAEGGPAKWKVENGALVVTAGAGGIVSKKSFGDVQLHLEWASPVPATGRSQGRGNSGVFFMGLYEVQVLDSFRNETYADGQAASIYGQYPPLVNACRPPGEWQSYDIVFRRPHFDSGGRLLKPARLTVVHNGVVVQDNVELLGPTVWLHYQPYKAHADRLPMSLQEHGNPVRFRNIWAREIGEKEEFQLPEAESPAFRLRRSDLKNYAGSYTADNAARMEVRITEKKGRLYFGIPFREQELELIPRSAREFALRTTDARVLFDLGVGGRADGLRFEVAGDQAFAAKRR